MDKIFPKFKDVQFNVSDFLISKEIRRLKGKKQVFSLLKPDYISKSDYVHERLTHSLEVDAIALEISNLLRDKPVELEPDSISIIPNDKLIECIAFAHDYGHTPFGHVGETAISDFLQRKTLYLFFKNASQNNESLPLFKHNCYSAFLLTRKKCSNNDIIDGVLKHTSINKLNGNIVDPLAFGLTDFLPHELICGTNNNYLVDDFPYTLEGQIVAIADEIAQILSDLEDSYIVLDMNFLNDCSDVSLRKNSDQSLKEYLIDLRLKMIKDVADTTKIKFYTYFKKNNTNLDSNILSEKIVSFSSQFESNFSEFESLRNKKLHQNPIVVSQNKLSYMIINANFLYYLKDAKNLLSRNGHSIYYLSNSMCKIRNSAQTKKLKSTITKEDDLNNYLRKKYFNSDFINKLNKLIVFQSYNKNICADYKNNFIEICNFLSDYFIYNYGENNLLDTLSKCLIKEIAYCIAKMTDKFAVNTANLYFRMKDNSFRLKKYVKIFCNSHISNKQISFLQSDFKVLFKESKKLLLTKK